MAGPGEGTPHPSLTPDEPMTEDQIWLVVADPVAAEALLTLERRPTWTEWNQSLQAYQRFRDLDPRWRNQA